MSYKITDYTYSQAKKLGLEVKPSKAKGKKIAVYKNGKLLGNVGALGYKDYPTYLAAESKGLVPKGTAAKRRKSYKARHNNYRHNKYTNSWLADKLLW